MKSVKDPMKLDFNISQTKIDSKSPGKYPVSMNILKSLTMFCFVLLHIIAFKICICIMDCAFTKSSTVGPRCLPYHT